MTLRAKAAASWTIIAIGVALLLVVEYFRSARIVGSASNQLQQDRPTQLPPPVALSSRLEPLPGQRLAEQWIVLTASALPSESGRAALESAQGKGWQCVVAIDESINEEASGLAQNWSQTCKVVDPAVLPFSDYNVAYSHHRKNLGYIFAIQQGARLILDAQDDDGLLPALLSVEETYMRAELSVQGLSPFAIADAYSPFLNVMAQFGAPNAWPRGLPLNAVAASRTPRSCEPWLSSIRATVHHFVVDTNPDVAPVCSALFPQFKLHVPLSPEAKTIAVPEGLFSPFNSRSTLVHYDAFWSLLFPATDKMDEGEIARSLRAQRLMWDAGQRLAVSPRRSGAHIPSTLDAEEIHRLARAAEAEVNRASAYEQIATRLAREMISWSSNATSLAARHQELIEMLIGSSLASAEEARLVQAWSHDLARAGYAYPPIAEGALVGVRKALGCSRQETLSPEAKRLCEREKNTSAPLLSIATCGRNDDYGGSRRNRTQVYLRLLEEFANSAPDVPIELVLTEYNPPADRKSMKDEFVWPRAPNLRVRIVTVPPSVHNKLKARYGQSTADLLEYVAKNTAIRRARGEFVVSSNTDDIFNPLLMELLRRRFFKKGVFYTAQRKEAPPQGLYDLSHPTYADVFAAAGIAPLVLNRSSEETTRTIDELLRKPSMAPARQATQYWDNPGDFLLMHRDDWALVRGNPEVGTVAFVDGWVQAEATGRGLLYVHLDTPFVQLHLSHASTWQTKNITPSFNLSPIANGESKTPNDENWGLWREETTVIDIA